MTEANDRRPSDKASGDETQNVPAKMPDEVQNAVRKLADKKPEQMRL
jgi:hypothetical protein